MKYLRGDLSAPVLAIIVTIGIIAAGLVLLAWFWWFAPQAGKTGTLVILGTPVAYKSDTQYNVAVSVRNTGNANVTIQGMVVEGVTCSSITVEVGGTTRSDNKIQAGESAVVEATCQADFSDKKAVNGYLITDAGTYSFTATVLG